MVCVRAAVRLYVRIVAPEQLLGALYGKLLHFVDVHTAAVIPLSGITLRVFVRQVRTYRFHDGARNEVLAGYELYVALLPSELAEHGVRDVLVCLCNEFKIHNLSPVRLAARLF